MTQQPSRKSHIIGWSVFVGLAFLLCGFVVWATMLATSIQTLREGVTINVRSLIHLQRIQHTFSEHSVLPLPQQRAVWRNVDQQLKIFLERANQTRGHRITSFVQLRELARKVRLALLQSLPSRKLLQLAVDAAKAIDQTIRALRHANALLSRQLAHALDRLYLLVVSSITLSASCFVLFVLVHNRHRRAEAFKHSLEEALRQEEIAHQEADKANLAKSKFLAMMSHEFRTPLHGISGAAELLRDTNLSRKQREFTEIILQSSHALLVMVNEVLDFSKMEAETLELQSVLFSPQDCLQKSAQILLVQAMNKGLHLNLTIAPDVPEIVLGDPLRLRQVLINLLANAVKFSTQGTISLRLEVMESREHSVILKFSVEDQGVGLSPEETGRIFSPFYQVDMDSHRGHGGSGLGLAICQRIVQAMGGELRVESVLHQGSTFWFTAPVGLPEVSSGEELTPDELPDAHPLFSIRHQGQVARLPHTPPGGTLMPQCWRHLHVLIVEDNVTNRRILCLYLDTWGHTYCQAENGQQALLLLESEPFDAILMDCNMPVMDGLETTRVIRSNATPYANIPIIALTAWATSDEQQRCLDAGMNHFLTKPIQRTELEHLLEEILVQKQATNNGNNVAPQISGAS